MLEHRLLWILPLIAAGPILEPDYYPSYVQPSESEYNPIPESQSALQPGLDSKSRYPQPVDNLVAEYNPYPELQSARQPGLLPKPEYYPNPLPQRDPEYYPKPEAEYPAQAYYPINEHHPSHKGNNGIATPEIRPSQAPTTAMKPVEQDSQTTIQNSPINRGIFGQLIPNFQCEKGNGFYAVPNSCDTFIDCKLDEATKYTCPDGLLFNPTANWNEYPCAYPSEVSCAADHAKQTPQPTDQCPRQYGFYLLRDGECSKYIMCQAGKGTIMDCPYGLVFNEKISSCDWPENMPDCSLDLFKNFKCPEPPVFRDGQISDIIYKSRYGVQCKQYIACQKGHPRLLSCEPGLLFDEASQACIYEKNVTCISEN